MGRKGIEPWYLGVITHTLYPTRPATRFNSNVKDFACGLPCSLLLEHFFLTLLELCSFNAYCYFFCVFLMDQSSKTTEHSDCSIVLTTEVYNL